MLPIMAVKITKETYPIAIACLSKDFELIPKHEVMGWYLVINCMVIERITISMQILTVDNDCMSKDVFDRNFFFISKEKKNKFMEVCQNI